MKTLLELGLDNARGSNHASYYKDKESQEERIFCGWMDLHDDSGSLGSSNCPFFCIKPLFWDNKAVFVSKLPNYKPTCLTKDQFLESKCIGFGFDAMFEHGLLTKKLAEKYLKDYDNFAISKEYLRFVDKCQGITGPKMVWTWDNKPDLTKYLFSFNNSID